MAAVMPSLALPEDELHLFLRRRRRRSGPVELPPLGRFLADTLDLTARLVPSQAGSLLLDDPTVRRGRSALTFVAVFGRAADQLVGVRVPSGQGIVGHVYEHGHTYRTSDASGDPHFFRDVDTQSAFRTRSVLAAPVRLEQSVCGVFELVNRRGRAHFSDRDTELVELVAQYVSRAILNAVDVVKHNELAHRDELTGLLNVRGLEPHLEQAVARARRTGGDVAVLFVDVDRLKRINDRLGHRAGSEALRRVGAALQGTVGARGTAFRFGGDEFVVVCPGLGAAEGEALADELAAAAKEARGPMPHGGRLPAVSISVGVASLRASLGTEERRGPSRGQRLLTAADKALYRAKRAGRGRAARAYRRDDTLGRGKRA